jgi:multidrug efflux pump subunit AcrA (membrane-fusion protein)
MKDLNEHQQIIHTGEVQDIITRTPSWLVNWGSLSIFIAIGIFLVISWLVKYPDILRAKVVITSLPPPLPLVVRSSGHLKLMKKEGDSIQAGEVVAYIASSADPHDVLKLSQELSNNVRPSNSDYSLGTLSTDFAGLITAINEQDLFDEGRKFDVELAQLSRQKKTLDHLEKTLIVQRNISQEEVSLAQQKFRTDSTLFVTGVIPLIEYNQSKIAWLQQLRMSKSIAAAVINNEIQRNSVEKQMSDLRRQKEIVNVTVHTNLRNNRGTLLSRIDQWKESYLIMAPAQGKVAFSGVVEDGMFVSTGTSLGFVITEKSHFVAKAQLPVMGSGKVRIGQRVNILLDNYPFEQFGMVRGIVESMSTLPREQVYFLTIGLPDGLRTSQRVNLEFKQELSGNTNIITADLRLAERFIYKFRGLLRELN